MSTITDQSESVQYVIHSLSESDATPDGNVGSFWSNKDGWGSLQTASLFSTKDRMSVYLPMSANNDAAWMLVEEARTLVSNNIQHSPAPSVTLMISLDGGETFAPAPSGARIIYKKVIVPGEDSHGELHLNATPEGLITDLWVSREEHLDHNLGTSSEFIEDCVARLVDDPPMREAVSQNIRTAYIEAYACSDYGDGPLFAKLSVTPKFISKLNQLSNLCKDHNLSEVRVCEYPDWWGPGDEDELRLTCGELVVTKTEFWFVDQPKHSDYHIETRAQGITEFLNDIKLSSDDVLFFAEHDELPEIVATAAK